MPFLFSCHCLCFAPFSSLLSFLFPACLNAQQEQLQHEGQLTGCVFWCMNRVLFEYKLLSFGAGICSVHVCCQILFFILCSRYDHIYSDIPKCDLTTSIVFLRLSFSQLTPLLLLCSLLSVSQSRSSFSNRNKRERQGCTYHFEAAIFFAPCNNRGSSWHTHTHIHSHTHVSPCPVVCCSFVTSRAVFLREECLWSETLA